MKHQDDKIEIAGPTSSHDALSGEDLRAYLPSGPARRSIDWKRKSGLALYGSSNINSWINTPIMAGREQINCTLEQDVLEYVAWKQRISWSRREPGFKLAEEQRGLEDEQRARREYQARQGSEDE